MNLSGNPEHREAYVLRVEPGGPAAVGSPRQLRSCRTPAPGPAVSISCLQCLNVRHGPQDATFLAHDLPEYLPSILRVQPQGPA